MRRFIEVQVLLLAPIAPHWCEHMWRNVLKKEGSVTQAAWPVPEAYDDTILLKDRFLRQTMYRLRKSQEKAVLVRACVFGACCVNWSSHAAVVSQRRGVTLLVCPLQKKTPCDAVLLYVAKEYPSWQQAIMKVLEAEYNEVRNALFPFAWVGYGRGGVP